MFRKWHRFLIRQYFYPIFLFLLIIFLIKWNLRPKPGTTGSRFDVSFSNLDFFASTPQQVLSKPIIELKNEIAEKNIDTGPAPPPSNGDVTEKAKIISGEILPKATPIIPRKPKGNHVTLEVYMEAQCPDTTGFIKRQLVPAWEKLKKTGRVHVSIIPFGKANCQRKDDDFELIYLCKLIVFLDALANMVKPNVI